MFQEVANVEHDVQVSSQKGKLTAGQIEERAVNGGDPKVGGAGVKQHSEVLRRGANADHPIVLGLRRQESS